jgi:hypothetical protein
MLGGRVVVVAIICFVMCPGGKIGVARPIKSCTGQVGSTRLSVRLIMIAFDFKLLRVAG